MTTTAETDGLTLTPRIMALRLEVTDRCDKEWLAKNKIAKVFELYVYNERLHVNCCEMTPSYECRFVAHQWTWDSEFDSRDEKNDEFVEGIAEEFGRMDAQQDDTYIHVRSAEKVPLNRRARYGHRQRFLVLSVKECKGMTHEEAIEKAWEYLRCNEM